MVEEMPGSIVQNIMNLFYLPEDLAKKYASIVFIACIRFEMSKRKLQHLSFAHFKKCTESIMEFWTYKIIGTNLRLSFVRFTNTSLLPSGPEYYDTEMDKEFLLELRELKILIEKDKEHKQ